MHGHTNIKFKHLHCTLIVLQKLRLVMAKHSAETCSEISRAD